MHLEGLLLLMQFLQLGKNQKRASAAPPTAVVIPNPMLMKIDLSDIIVPRKAGTWSRAKKLHGCYYHSHKPITYHTY